MHFSESKEPWADDKKDNQSGGHGCIISRGDEVARGVFADRIGYATNRKGYRRQSLRSCLDGDHSETLDVAGEIEHRKD